MAYVVNYLQMFLDNISVLINFYTYIYIHAYIHTYIRIYTYILTLLSKTEFLDVLSIEEYLNIFISCGIDLYRITN